jgi:hypothetical protein
MLDETEVETVADAQPFPAANAPRILPAEPQGFAEWWARLQGVADRGTAALEAAWKESPVEHRRYLTSVYPEKWNALKAIACGEVVHA